MRFEAKWLIYYFTNNLFMFQQIKTYSVVSNLCKIIL